MLFHRKLAGKLKRSLPGNPVTAIIGARQVGKSTLAKSLLDDQDKPLIYLDLEKPSDRTLLSEPEDFFNLHKEKCICLD